MELEEIGFYTLSNTRALNSSEKSSLYRCELIITSRCNFKCPYCRSLNTDSDITYENGKRILDLWINEGLKNVRFSGGEPTLHENLIDFVTMAKEGNVEKIAISTNGSADFSLYEKLINAGVNDFSISLDACCSSLTDIMTGKNGYFYRIIENIKRISNLTYVTIGVVLTEKNINEIENIINFIKDLGVSDIRIIPAAQYDNKLRKVKILDKILNSYPILKYRLTNKRTIRGLEQSDSNRCKLVLDDMVVWNNYHYPCIIYLREGGKAIGKIGKNMRTDRKKWYKEHDCLKDKICYSQCLDVCRDFNNFCRGE